MQARIFIQILKFLLAIFLGLSCVYLSYEDLKKFYKLKIEDHVALVTNKDQANEIVQPSDLMTFNSLRKNITTRFLTMNSLILTNSPKNTKYRTLCQLGLDYSCYSNYIAEVIEAFWVVAPIYSFYQGSVNLMYQLHIDFQHYIESIGLSFCTIEAIKKERNQKYLITNPGKEPREIQVEFYDDVYLRENFLNVAIKKIKDWQYMAWIDAHQIFENPYWWEESIYYMEKYGSVQIFQVLQKLDGKNETLNINPGSIYVSLWQNKLGWQPFPYYGNAFGIRREIYEKIWYILDECIAGCCDCVYNYVLMDPSIEYSYMDRWPDYLQSFDRWVKNAKGVFKGSRKSIRGKLFHLKHEEKFSYFSMLETVNSLGFNVERDLARNENFTLVLKNKDIKKKIDSINFLSYYIIEIIVGVVILGCLVFVGFLVMILRFQHKGDKKHES